MLKHYSSFCFIFCLFLPLMSKADFERVVRPLRNGTLVLNSRCRAALMRFTPEWKPVSQYQARPDAGYPRSSVERFELRGTFDAFRMNEVVTATSSNAFHYSMELSAENPVPCHLLFLGINLPLGKGIRVEIDGKPVAMPEQYKTKKVFDASAQSVTVKDPQGEFTITGNCHLILIGKFLRDGEEYYQLRLLPAGKHPKTVKFWKLELDFQLHFSRPGIDSQPIDLAALFNRGFRSGEGALAWTGQGAAQEPRTLQPGEYRFHGIRIHIADPGSNHGRTCLILGRDLGPKSAGVDIANFPEQAKYLYLFHAAAWPPMLLKPLGAIELSYEDGSRETVPVIAGRDCDNWFRPPMTLPNASPVWKTELAGSSAGLYLSAFPLKKPVKRINFRLSSASSAWIIAAASFADGRAEFPAPEPLVVKPGPEWLPIQFSGETEKGSPLDFSCFRDFPAGKYGRILANAEGHLVFENAPEKRIRLFGTNLVGTANFLEREDVERFLSAIERLGYNTVRLHHFEEGILKQDAADSVTLDPVKLDQFHYLISRLKERGFYISLDLYASRKLKPGDNIPEFDNTGDYSMKNLICISPAALENWKRFARNLLTAPNPYTGMSLAEDPVLCSMNLVNENPLTGIWNHARSSRAAQKLYRQKFEEYLRSQKTAPDGKSVTRNGLFIEFLNALQLRCIKEQMRFLKEELGVKALLTDLNCYAEYSLAGVRSELELVDNHQYWDHPSYPLKRGDYPFVFQNRSSISMNANNPRSLMPTRVFGKPFTVTEFNFCVPNTYRVECPSVFGGYAALQDWDGLYRFAWSHSRDGMRKDAKRRLSQFDIVNNIQAQMADRILYMLFVRGDVKAAGPAVAFEFKPEQVRALKGNSKAGRYPPKFQMLGLFCRIGSLPQCKSFPGVQKVDPLRKNWEKHLPWEASAAVSDLIQGGEIASSTGELTLNTGAKSMRIVTPASEVLTGENRMTGKVIASAQLNGYQTVALHSLDGRPLTESGKLLLIQLTDLTNSELSFTDASRRILTSWGKCPHLLARGSAELVLALPRKMRIVPLELDGTLSKQELPVSVVDGKQCFRIATDQLPGGTLACLLTSE